MYGIKVIFDAHEDFVAQNASRSWVNGWRSLPVDIIARVLRVIVNLSADQVLTATNSIAKNHRPKRTTVINNYPIRDELRNPKGDYMPLSCRPRRAIYVGGMNRIRGLFEVIEAVGACEQLEGIDLVGTIADAAFEAELKSLLGWQKVCFHGHCSRAEVAHLMAQARFGIVTFHPLPNHIDAKPNKLFEYMSAGLAVLYSDFPLWRSICDNPPRGLATDPQDSVDIARQMAALLDHPDLDAMGQVGKEAARTEFTWEDEVRKLSAIVGRLSLR